jgi:hypothetical protein
MTHRAPFGSPDSPVGARSIATALGLLVPLLALSACGTFRQTCAGGCNVSGDSPTGSVDEEIGAFVPLLQSFELAFGNGDHPLGLVAVGSLRPSGGGTRRFYLELADGDGDDPIHGTARYFRWPEGSRAALGLPEDGPYGVERFVSRSGCRASCRLEIPDFDSHENVLVITGFRFRFPEGENHLRAIALWPSIPDIGVPATSYLATFQDDDGEEPFDVELSYALFPRTWSNRGVIAGSGFLRPNPGPTFSTPLNAVWRGRIPLLGGFHLRYDGGDENLLQMAVHATDERVTLTLRDNDGAEGIHVEARYHGFCPAPAGINSHIVECP